MQKNINIQNKKARFLYEILDKYTAGIVLTGTEIKSIRLSKASIAESFCEFNEFGELFIINMTIEEYAWGTHYNHKPKASRKLLLNKRELKKLEKEVKNISGVEKITSNSFQDYGMIIVEFADKVTIEDAKVKIKDKVDFSKADTDWPNLDNGSKVEPNVFELNISEEVPILNINLKGNYTTQQLKKYGELLQDDIEEISEVKKVDILGVDDKEVEIAVDIFKMTAAQVSFDEIQNAVKYENMTLSGGNLISQGSRNNIRIVGEIKDPKELENIILNLQKVKDVFSIERMMK